MTVASFDPHSAGVVMADHDAQRLIAISLGKIANFNTQRRGCSLHKNLLVSSVIQRARTFIVADHSTSSVPDAHIGDESGALTTTNGSGTNDADRLQHPFEASYYNHQDDVIVANFNKLYVSEAVRWDAIPPASHGGLPAVPVAVSASSQPQHPTHLHQCEETTTVVNMDSGVTEVIRTSPQAPLLPSTQEDLDEVRSRDETNRKRRYLSSDGELFSSDDSTSGSTTNASKRQRRDCSINPFWLSAKPLSMEMVSASFHEDNADPAMQPDESMPDALHNSVNMINYLSLTSDFGEMHKGWSLDHNILHYTSDASTYSTDFLVSSPSDYCIKRTADLFSGLPIDVSGQTLALTV